LAQWFSFALALAPMREINDMLFTHVLLLVLCDDIYPS